MEEGGGISWPLEEGSETNPNSCFPTHTDSKNSLYLSISKLHGPGPKIRWRSTYYKLWMKFMKGHLVYFVHVLICHQGGFKVLKSSVVTLFLIPLHMPSSPCLFLLQCSSFSKLGPSFVSKTNVSNLGSIIFS